MANHTPTPCATSFESRRVLVAAADTARCPYLALSGPASFPTWDVLLADSFERAHFVLQMDHCDVLLLDASLFLNENEGLPWLLARHPLPTLYVADTDSASVLAALKQGAHQWLSRTAALSDPAVLSETLHRVAAVGDWQRRARVAGEALQDAQRQVSRLVALLWEAAPIGGSRWFTQRHMLERLDQEVARCDRQSGALSIVLGEMHSLVRPRFSPDEAHALAAWTAERLALSKRRADVAGQYGPHGFLLVLPGTTNAGAVAGCKRLQSLLEAASGPLPQLQVCFGVASYSATTATVKALLGRAEERLQLARAGNGERVVA
jgi:diguanylate cyclase (GGDEF)-like protein